jgi:hypothetical protein
MKKILGFIAQKIGMPCSSRNSRAFIEGWLLGAWVTVKAWAWRSPAFGRREWRIGVAIHTRKDFKFGFFLTKYHYRVDREGAVFSFGYGSIVLSANHNK